MAFRCLREQRGGRTCGQLFSTKEGLYLHQHTAHPAAAASSKRRSKGPPLDCPLPDVSDPSRPCGRACCNLASFYSHRLRVHKISTQKEKNESSWTSSNNLTLNLN